MDRLNQRLRGLIGMPQCREAPQRWRLPEENQVSAWIGSSKRCPKLRGRKKELNRTGGPAGLATLPHRARLSIGHPFDSSRAQSAKVPWIRLGAAQCSISWGRCTKEEEREYCKRSNRSGALLRRSYSMRDSCYESTKSGQGNPRVGCLISVQKENDQ